MIQALRSFSLITKSLCTTISKQCGRQASVPDLGVSGDFPQIFTSPGGFGNEKQHLWQQTTS